MKESTVEVKAFNTQNHENGTKNAIGTASNAIEERIEREERETIRGSWCIIYNPFTMMFPDRTCGWGEDERYKTRV